MGVLDKLRRSTKTTKPPKQVARMYEFGSNYYVCTVRWIAEVGAPTVIPVGTDCESLGTVILSHLDQFDGTELDIRDAKKSEWPAFKASTARSVREFEKSAWQCDLSRSPSCFEVWAKPYLSLDDELSVYCTANAALADAVGRAALRALTGTKALRDSGLL